MAFAVLFKMCMCVFFQINTFISSLRNGGVGAAGMTGEKNIKLNEVRIRLLRTISLEHTVYKTYF